MFTEQEVFEMMWFSYMMGPIITIFVLWLVVSIIIYMKNIKMKKKNKGMVNLILTLFYIFGKFITMKGGKIDDT